MVDAPVDGPEPVGERFGGHAAAPEPLADAIDAARADALQVHLDRRLVDVLLPAPVAVDYLRVEERALEFPDFGRHVAGLDHQAALVMVRPAGAPLVRALVPLRAGRPRCPASR